MNTTSTETTATTARTEGIAALWVKYPERLVTCSTGIVHVAIRGTTLCGTRTAVRASTTGTEPTCKNCGAA